MRSRLLVTLWLLTLSAGANAAPVLVDDTWLAARLNKPDLLLVDMSAAEQYTRFHLPGAVHLSYSDIVMERRPDGVTVRLADNELYAKLGALGIDRARHVVIYDDVGGLNAGRLFWELERIGHPEVSVLDGGLVTWILKGRKVTNVPARIAPVTYRAPNSGRANEAGLEDMKILPSTRKAVLLDVRSEDEYRGETRQPRSGHVPGAQLWPWEQAVDFSGGFVRTDVQRLKQSLDRLGAGDKHTPVIAYCRSGHRAAQSYLVLRSLGYDNVKLYANSMNEYTRHAELPLKHGDRP